MTLQEAGARRQKRAKTKPLPFKAAARARREAQATQGPVPGFERVMPFPDWCRLKGFSINTGKRLRAAGKIRVVRLSATRVGISASEDARFMRACESA
jgi:hypothetical protein